jgi:hypothetical protein
MDGKAIVENYRKMGKEPEFTQLDINQLKLHRAKYLTRLLEPVMDFKPGTRTGGTGWTRVQILKKGHGIQECITIDEYRHYMAFTLIPEVEETVKKYRGPNFADSSYRQRRFDEVKLILEDLFPEMDLTVDPRRKLGESWDTFYSRHRPNFSTLLRILYDVSYDLPEDAIRSYLKGSDHDSWEITPHSNSSNSD